MIPSSKRYLLQRAYFARPVKANFLFKHAKVDLSDSEKVSCCSFELPQPVSKLVACFKRGKIDPGMVSKEDKNVIY